MHILESSRATRALDSLKAWDGGHHATTKQTFGWNNVDFSRKCGQFLISKKRHLIIKGGSIRFVSLWCGDGMKSKTKLPKQSLLEFTEDLIYQRKNISCCQKRPQNPPLDPLQTRLRCVKTSQNHAPDPTWNHKITQTLPRSEKNHFWAAGATIARDKWTPKGASKRDQEQQNPRSMCYAKKTRFAV